jgi:hypothetical protein
MAPQKLDIDPALGVFFMARPFFVHRGGWTQPVYFLLPQITAGLFLVFLQC